MWATNLGWAFLEFKKQTARHDGVHLKSQLLEAEVRISLHCKFKASMNNNQTKEEKRQGGFHLLSLPCLNSSGRLVLPSQHLGTAP